MSARFVHEMFQETAAQYPAAIAMAGADRQLTYEELDGWSNNIANRLLEAGAQRGAIVFVAAQSTFSVVGSILGVLKMGGVFAPVDPHQPESRLRALTAQVPPSYILSEDRCAGTIAATLGSAAPVIVVDRDEPAADAPCLLPRRGPQGLENVTAAPQIAREPDEMCYVYFTSGSTGKPKAIAGRLKSIDHFIRWEISTFDLGPGTVVSQLTSPLFDAFLRDTFTPLCAGGTMRVAETRETVLDPVRLRAWLNESRVNLIHTVPSLFRTILGPGLSPDDFPALRFVLLAGEPLLPSDVQRWTDVFGGRIRLCNLYGPSETTMVKLFHMVEPEDAQRRAVPVGRAMPGARALVIDEAGRPAAEGTIGEIYIRTPYRTLGYYDNPELTQQVFVPNPLSEDPADIVYRTGDLGRLLDNGEIEFLGRKDQQVKVRGVRVELGEIEDAILATNRATEAAVAVREDHAGNSYLCAYVVVSEEATTDEIRERLAAALPEYLIPSSFLALERLPRTATGKIDRKSLPAPEELRPQTSSGLEPRTETEVAVTRICAEVLGLEKTSIEDNFFQLGGHSLLAMGLLSRLSMEFDVELPLAILFEVATLEHLAQEIDTRRATDVRLETGSFEESSLQFPSGLMSAERLSQLTEAEVDAMLDDILKIG
jgi:amino acid adenylation domain-containing protein